MVKSELSSFQRNTPAPFPPLAQLQAGRVAFAVTLPEMLGDAGAGRGVGVGVGIAVELGVGVGVGVAVELGVGVGAGVDGGVDRGVGIAVEGGTEVFAIVRDKRTPMVVSPTPFTPNRYYRG